MAACPAEAPQQPREGDPATVSSRGCALVLLAALVFCEPLLLPSSAEAKGDSLQKTTAAGSISASASTASLQRWVGTRVTGYGSRKHKHHRHHHDHHRHHRQHSRNRPQTIDQSVVVRGSLVDSRRIKWRITRL